jgi:hypothetical protein
MILRQFTVSAILPEDFPPELLELAMAIRFRNERLAAVVANEDLRLALAKTVHLVRARAQGHARSFDVFAVTLTEGAAGTLRFTGELVSILGPFPPGNPGHLPILAQLRDLRPNEFALLDAAHELVVPQFIPIITVTLEPVAAQLLANGDETKALLIPALGSQHMPLASGDYRLDFRLDRARYRSDAPDDESNYRAEASIPLKW